MASNKRRRVTAEQALALFRDLTDVETDESDLESDRSSSSSDFRSTSRTSGTGVGGTDNYESDTTSSDSDEDDRGALAQPGTSHRPKRKRQNGARSSNNMPISDWRSVKAEDRPVPKTSLDFPFLPKNRNEPGVWAELTADSSALSCFRCLFDDEVTNLLLDAINRYAQVQVQKHTPPTRHSRYSKWTDLSKEELFKFLAVLTAMGIDERDRLEDYRSEHMALYTPFHSQMFSQTRFEMIYSTMLHVGEPDSERKAKIEPFVNLLIDKYNNAFTPYENLSLDEMIVGWKGRWKYKQYNATKPHKYHIKSFGLTDSSTGYVLNLLTYYGKDTSYDPETDQNSGHAIKIFDTLLKPIGKGYHVFADRYYTTRALIDHLISKDIYYTGTVQVNRVGFPPEIKTMRLGHMESKHWMTETDSIFCLSWKDKKAKKPVVLASTKACADFKNKGRKSVPSSIDCYNQNMNGCDLTDRMVGYFGLQKRRSFKWWKKIFHWILEITTNNAHKLYVLTRPPTTKKKHLQLKFFKLQLIEQLAEAAAELAPNNAPVNPSGGRPRTNPVERLEYTKHMIIYTPEDRRCRVCSRPGKKIRTNFACEGCTGQPHLHPKHCFKIWHTQANLPN
ncbi:PiggyBac transposable element-derived protein 4 [Plakobranchus ocellatus]|uniref:PiggyBac transposable element-derived protein 4 n=1 Tax=Plakobranchus ocellatus TaxID=259542 RepID=A0AAV4A8E0_9GAST|nr:PiggyBac transposable element-derived protein 4 [Plakobranchus ocellatus]